MAAQDPDYRILRYVPNIIDYARLLLLIASWLTLNIDAGWALGLYVLSASLDFVDGYAARKLDQTSAFGAWLDIVIDNLGRGMLWCSIYHFGYLVAALEWLTFVCTHTLGAEWKASFVRPPVHVTKVMANNFKTLWGLAAISGLHVLPIWLYAHYTGSLSALYVPYALQYTGIAVLAAGRALCMSVELWCVWAHIQYLLCPGATPHSKSQPTT